MLGPNGTVGYSGIDVRSQTAVWYSLNEVSPERALRGPETGPEASTRYQSDGLDRQHGTRGPDGHRVSGEGLEEISRDQTPDIDVPVPLFLARICVPGMKARGPAAHAPDVRGLGFRRYRGEEDLLHFLTIWEKSRPVDRMLTVMTLERLQAGYRNLINCDPARDIFVAQVDDEVVGYGWLNWTREVDGSYVYEHYSMLAPEWRGRGIWRALLRRQEARIRDIAAGCEPDAPKKMNQWTSETELHRVALLESEGHEPDRYFYEMLRDLTREIEPHPVPDGLEIRPVLPEQTRQIYESHWEASLDHWGAREMEDADYRRFCEDPTFEPQLWVVAWDGNRVAGNVLNWIDENENEVEGRQWGYTEEISVGRRYRNRGLARALISRSLRMLREKGMTHANLGVDTQNPSGALRLYQGLGYELFKTYTVYRKLIGPAAG